MMKLPLGFCSVSCFFSCIFVSSFSLNTLVSLPLPPPDQIDILLAFKNEFKFSSTMCYKPSPATKSWTKDAITFDGVVFDNETGVVTELHLEGECLSGSLKANSSLFRFQHLRYLDLSVNEFASSPFLGEFGRLTSLEHLDLKSNGMVGEILSSIGNLSRLTYLQLSNNGFTGGFPFIYNLTKLSFIDLSWNHFSGTIPASLFTMPFLSSLYLHKNHLEEPLKTMNSSSSSKLKELFLSNNLFSGGILEPISKLVSLTHLDLSFNDFASSPFPSEFGKLVNLELLDLGSNSFIGEVPSSIANLSHLIDLDLSYNKFTGPIPSSLFTKSSSLSYLDLSGNHLSDPIQYINSSSSASKLLKLNLGDNLFSGRILEPILKLVNLTVLDLSFLNITYPINFSFLPLKSLKELDISGNGISWLSSIPNHALSTELTHLHCSSCNINELPKFLKKQQNLEWLDISNNNINEFPKFLKKQRNLTVLDMSNNNIQGNVPEWLWNLPSLIDVSLSNNSFDSFEGSQEALINSSVQSLEFDSNAFQGSFPLLPPRMAYLSARNNNFAGDIPISLCNATLSVLYLSNNNFSGSIPRCFRETLEELDLQNNSLTGRLSDSFNRRYPFLKILNVGHNQIIGKLPRSLVNCTSLEILNVESNRIIDTFPFWLKTLPNLQVIVLRSNGFHGPISSPQDPLSFLKLRIIDISHNSFTGKLPTDYFVNWSAALINMPEVYRLPEYMRSVYRVSYEPSIYLTQKGLTMEFEKILVTSTVIDFSRNRFGGQIPESIGLLKELVVLDLSNNDFVGHIPSSLAKLTKLQSLDLSRNQLSGEIPQKLAILTFLGYIDVSHNKLRGQIPQSTQFGGQSKSSFEGNVDLCGLPLQESCLMGNVAPTPPQTQQLNPPKEDQLLNWKAATIGYGPGVLFGLAIGQVLALYRPALYYKLFRL